VSKFITDSFGNIVKKNLDTFYREETKIRQAISAGSGANALRFSRESQGSGGMFGAWESLNESDGGANINKRLSLGMTQKGAVKCVAQIDYERTRNE
jgi:hypothetical protein